MFFLHVKAVAQLSEVGILTKIKPKGGLVPERHAMLPVRLQAPDPEGKLSFLPNHQRQASTLQTGICIYRMRKYTHIQT